MTKNKAWRTAYLNQCQDIIIDKPQETTYIDCQLCICSKLIVRTGSELVLRGSLKMGLNSEIIVERGARFVIEKGKISGKVTTPGYWKGITLSDGYADQVSITTSIVDYPSLAPASLVANGGLSNSSIKHAQVAIKSRDNPIGVLGGMTSLIHLDGLLISENEVGVSINNILNVRSINTHIHNVWFFQNVNDDLNIIAASDIDIRKCAFVGSSQNGVTLIDTELTGFNDCKINEKDIGMDIKCTYPYHPGFKLGDESGISNAFRINREAIHIGGGIGVGNTNDLEIFRAIFESGFLGIQVLGAAGYEIYNSNFPSVKHGILSAYSSIAENTIHCNQFSDDQGAFAIATIGDNRNLTMHSNEFDMANATSTGIWRITGDIFQVQSANFDFSLAKEENPPAGNQFFDVGSDFNIFYDGNTVDYLVPQLGGDAQYYPQTQGDYNSVFSDVDIIKCPEDSGFNSPTGGLYPSYFVPNDNTDTWQDPIGDPISLDEYLSYILNLPNVGGDDGPIRSEIARVRFALYRWVVYMLEHPDNYDLATIEDFVDSDYQRLLVGYYIYNGDPYNADRILDDLSSRVDDINLDFVIIQKVNMRRLFPSFHNLKSSYVPSSNELQNIRSIAEKYSENTGYASALYYLYTNKKVYPDFNFIASQPRSNGVIHSEDVVWVDIYPNPTDGIINLISNKGISEYTLYDSYGRLQFTRFVKEAKNITLEMDNCSKGIYILNVKCGSKIITKKVVKI